MPWALAPTISFVFPGTGNGLNAFHNKRTLIFSRSRTGYDILSFHSRCHPAAWIRIRLLQWNSFDRHYRSDWRSRVAYSIPVNITPKLSCVARLPARLNTYYSGHSLRSRKGRNASVPCLLQRLVRNPSFFSFEYPETSLPISPADLDHQGCLEGFHNMTWS